jgi:endonuclease/exonuclease/phosphatase family metal-dependent hydrolase
VPWRSLAGLAALAALGALAVGAGFALHRVGAAERRIAIHTGEAAVAPAPARATWRIAAWNLAHARGLARRDFQGGDAATRRQRLERIADTLAALDLDLVVLNEVDFDSSFSHRMNQARLVAERAGFPHRVEQRNHDVWLAGWRWVEGNALLSRHPVLAAEPVELPPRSRWRAWAGAWKRAVGVTVERADGERLRVVPIHLAFRAPDVRVASARRLLAWRDRPGPPVVLAGDFNATLSDWPGAEASRSGGTSIDLLLASGFRRAASIEPTPAHMTHRASRPRRVIDWILVPEDFRFARYEVVPGDLSDHRLVWAEVERLE